VLRCFAPQVELDAKRSGGERSVFTEVEGEAAVASELQRLLPGTLGPTARQEGNLEARLRAAGLEPFASFETVLPLCMPLTHRPSPSLECRLGPTPRCPPPLAGAHTPATGGHGHRR